MKKIILWILVIGWMAVIFSFSSQPATQSDGLSKGIIYKFIDFIESFSSTYIDGYDRDLKIMDFVDRFDHYFRKTAHFTVFFVLGILVSSLMLTYKFNGMKLVAISAVICLLYAISDECHQLFVPGRAGQIKDVLIDFSGSALAILTVWFFTCFYRKERVGQ